MLAMASPEQTDLVMPFHRYWADIKQRVDHALEAFLAERAARSRAIDADVATIVSAIHSLTMRGGKRFRPVLLTAAYEGYRGPGRADDVVMAGVALELLQSFFLIHDDWMDNDDIRRGGPSVHAMLREAFGSRSVGDATAIISGDYAAALANEALMAVAAAPARVMEALRLMAEMQEDVCFGQVMDVRGRCAEVERIHDLKTGSYTVRGPMAMGAALAGATSDEQAALAHFAKPLGVAFQIRDDILGTFGASEKTGKPAGNDLRQGKRTALVAELDGDPAARPLLERGFGRADADEADVQALTRYLVESGARARAEARLEGLMEQALRRLGTLAMNVHGKHILEGAVLALALREH